MDGAREGDFIETNSGLLFDVKGFIHPPGGVVAFLRYFPDPEGERVRDGVRYRKIYSLDDRLSFLRERFPDFVRYDDTFGRILSVVPIPLIKIRYEPSVYFNLLTEKAGLNPLEQETVNLASEIRIEAGIPKETIGVTGSVLVRLHKPDSDIDLICYGSKESRQAYSALGRLLEDPRSVVEPYDEMGLRKLYRFRRRDTEMRYSDFLKVERRKRLQGTYNGRDYYVRLLRDQTEATPKYGVLKFKPMGRATITAVISDDSESIFTPCRYRIREVRFLDAPTLPVRELISYRGRFCEQAKRNESVMASGEVERVEGESEIYHQIVLGNHREDFLSVISQ